jgi:endoglucanase
MKRVILFCIVVGVIAGAGLVAAQDDGLAPPAIDGEAVYIPFPVPITVDGDLGDWAGIQPVTVERGTQLSDNPAENGSFTFAVAADLENFYIYMTMPDQNIIGGQHGADTWNEDSLEFYLNLSGDRGATSYGEGIGQIRITPADIGNTDPGALTLGGTNVNAFTVSGFVFKTEDGWGFEAAVPFGDTFTPEHGVEIGFQAHANGASVQDRDVKLIWSLRDETDNSWQDPSLFGAGLFFEIGRTDVPQPTAWVEPEPEPELEPVVPAAVSVNQIGYLPTASKRGMIQTESEDPVPWELVDASGAVVSSGMTDGGVFDPASGGIVQQADFSAWTAPGTYTLVIDGVASAPFRIARRLYGDLSVDALRYFYLSRSGIPLEPDYAGLYARPAGHLTDAEITCFKGTDANGTEWPGCDYVIDGSGGWYDAGDYGKYVVNGGISVWTLHNLYERFPDAFPDGSLNIPESGNGVPDILDEARWEMEWLLKMQVPEGDPLAGMAFHKLHDRQWAGLPLLPPTEYDNDTANAHPGAGRYVYTPTTAATLNLAATAAQCARIWAEIDPDFAARCLSAAKSAWTAALAHDIILMGNTPGAGGGNYGDSRVSDEFYWAAAELYVTTGEAEYGDFLNSNRQHVRFAGPLTGDAASMSWGETAALGMISLAMVPNDLPDTQVESLRNNLIRAADAYLDIMAQEGYRVSLKPNSYYWGSNSSVLNNAIILALAHDFTGDEVYLGAVAEALDYLLGRNALHRSFITGYGDNAPEHPHHRFWANQGTFPPPPPGVVVGGPIGEPEEDATRTLSDPDGGPATHYVDDIEAYSSNEVAINWNAPLAWVVTYLDQETGGRPTFWEQLIAPVLR